MAAFLTDLPDWVKLLGAPALWSVFLACLLWFILKIIVPLMFPEKALQDFFTRHPSWGIAILLPLAASPLLLLLLITLNIFIQTILPQLESVRELQAYRQSLPRMNDDIAVIQRSLSSINNNIYSLQQSLLHINGDIDILNKHDETINMVINKIKTDTNAALSSIRNFTLPHYRGFDLQGVNGGTGTSHPLDCDPGHFVTGINSYVEDGHIKVQLRCMTFPPVGVQ